MSDSLWPHGLSSPQNSPGQNTRVGNLSLFQGIFPTPGLNPGLPHCSQILYQLSHKGSPLYLNYMFLPATQETSVWFLSQKEKDRYYLTALTCRIYNRTQMSLSTKQTHRHREQTDGSQGGAGGEGVDREVRISRGKLLLYIESMDYKVLLYSTGDYMQYPVRNHNGKGYFKDKKVKVKVAQLCPTLCKPYSPWNSLGQHTRVGSLSLLQGIFPTQGSNPHLPHCRQILYQLSHKGSPLYCTKW